MAERPEPSTMAAETGSLPAIFWVSSHTREAVPSAGRQCVEMEASLYHVPRKLVKQRAAELHRQNLATAPEWIGDAIACVHRGWAPITRT